MFICIQVDDILAWVYPCVYGHVDVGMIKWAWLKMNNRKNNLNNSEVF